MTTYQEIGKAAQADSIYRFLEWLYTEKGICLANVEDNESVDLIEELAEYFEVDVELLKPISRSGHI